jgi:hypothetical protein
MIAGDGDAAEAVADQLHGLHELDAGCREVLADTLGQLADALRQLTLQPATGLCRGSSCTDRTSGRFGQLRCK